LTCNCHAAKSQRCPDCGCLNGTHEYHCPGNPYGMAKAAEPEDVELTVGYDTETGKISFYDLNTTNPHLFKSADHEHQARMAALENLANHFRAQADSIGERDIKTLNQDRAYKCERELKKMLETEND
jgi:hypothetical protein